MKFVAFALLLLCGCIGQQISIEATKSWENHYFSVEEFKAGTESIQLEKGETIWVLSNKTLKRTLENVKGK